MTPRVWREIFALACCGLMIAPICAQGQQWSARQQSDSALMQLALDSAATTMASDPASRRALAKQLMAAGANPANLSDSAIYKVALRGDAAMMELLWRSGLPIARHVPVMRGAIADEYALKHYGSLAGEGGESGRLAVIKLALSRGVPVDARDSKGRTPLMLAVDAFKPEIVRFLLSAGADVRAEAGPDAYPKYMGRTPISIAMWHKRTNARANEIYDLLIRWSPAGQVDD